jgi:SAM-dependent methyltransferase
MVEAMLAAANVKPGEMVYDLGCGDGRMVITAARKFYARGMGFDLDVELIQAARAAAAAAGVRHTVSFHRANIFSVDLSPADVVTLYLLREMNGRLVPQLRELKPGARVVTYEFDIPGLPPPARTGQTEYIPGVQGRVLVWDAPFACLYFNAVLCSRRIRCFDNRKRGTMPLPEAGKKALVELKLSSSKAQQMEGLLTVYWTPRTPQDAQDAYKAMLKIVSAATLNPVLRKNGKAYVAPPKLTGAKALTAMGVPPADVTVMLHLAEDLKLVKGKVAKGVILDRMEEIAKRHVRDTNLMANLKGAGLV